MVKAYEKEKERNKMQATLKSLMNDSLTTIRLARDNEDNTANHLYNLETHFHLRDNCWELLFPLDKQKWPNAFQDLHYDSQLKWPNHTTYAYAMNVVMSPQIPAILLHFGYACLNDKLTRTAFFVVQEMVDYQIMPQGMVLDPIANAAGIEPSFYIGLAVKKEHIENFIFNKVHPLEAQIRQGNEKRHKERLFDSYMESYNLQMFHHPDWFPPQLIKFAEENNLYVPPQSRDNSKL